MGMFDGLKRLLGVSSEQPVANRQERVVTGAFEQSASLKPWEDRSVAPEERKRAYGDLVREKLEGIQIAFDRACEAQDVSTQKDIMNSPETKKWMDEGAWLQRASAKKFCERIDRPRIIRELLGKNFLGAEAWNTQKIDVGEVPPLPETITEGLLTSDCPLHPGGKIKDTHLLVLVPTTVNGEPYSAFKLNEVWEGWKWSGGVHSSIWFTAWKSEPWARIEQAASEWVLIPKSDPDPTKVPEGKHFRNKAIEAQDRVHQEHYKDYREAKTVELMTAVLLCSVVNQEYLLPTYLLRCQERNDSGGRVCVGGFDGDRLTVATVIADYGGPTIGRALARRSYV